MVILYETMSLIYMFVFFQIDSDLVFDDGTATNDYISHVDHRKTSSNARLHSNTSQHFQSTKSNHGASSSDHQLVAPVEIPLEDPEEAKPDSSKDIDSSFFGKISEYGKRVKRQWPLAELFDGNDDSEKPSSTTEGTGLFGFGSANFLGWFGGSDGTGDKPESHSSASSASKKTSKSESQEILQVTTPQDNKYRNKRSTTLDDITGEENLDDLVADEESTTDQPESVEDNETDSDRIAVTHKRGQLQHHSSDDEDYISEAASGSGMDSRTIPPTSAAPPADRQPSECIAKFCKG